VSWFDDNGVSAPQFAPYQGTAANSTMQGFVQSKVADPSLGTTNKYQGGRYLQQHPGDVEGLLKQPGFEGWTQAGADKITGPGGSTYDVRNANGAVQWTAISGPAWDKNGVAGVNSLGVNSGMAKDGIKGNYAAANAKASDAAGAAGTSRFGYAGSGQPLSSLGQGGTPQTGGGFQAGGAYGGGQAGPAPTVTPFTPAQNPQGAFQAPSTPGAAFQGPAPYQPGADFNPGSSVPTPQTMQQQHLQTPEGAQYNNFNLPPGFQAPTAEEAAQDPGYQFRLKQGLDAIQNSAAGKGVLHSGNTLKGLSDYGQESASQEYQNVYGRRLGESQKNYQEGFQTNQANNQGNLATQQANAQTGLQYGQANNQNTLAYGQANNAAQAQAQAAQYGQAANTYGMNAAQAAAAQQQNYQQGLGAYQANQANQAQQYGQAATTYGLNQGAQQQQYTQDYNANQLNNQQNLANYQAQGNLGLGYYSAGNQYQLGLGNLALGNRSQDSQNAYQQGQLGLQTSGQQFNQGLALNQNAWGQNYQLANLGQPGAPNAQGYGQQQGDIQQGIGNANAAGQIGSSDAWGQSLGQLGNLAGNYVANQTPQTGGGYLATRPYNPGQPGYGVLA
jgi:hypothetical protein